MKTVTPERRRFDRSTTAPRFGIDLLKPHASVYATTLNFGEGGMCFRLRQALEVRSLVRLRLTPEASPARSGPFRGGQPMECTGRVAWVIQRQDLSEAPPFYYDVGIEFVDPPPLLRQLILQAGGQPAPSAKLSKLPGASIRGRRYMPRIERETGQAIPWHLIVLVDGSPCFSGRYATKREAVGAWERFKRRQARPHVSNGRR